MEKRGKHTEKSRAELSAPIMIWFGIFIVSIIVSMWFIQKVHPISSESSRMNYDINQIRSAVDFACSTVSYSRTYNPRTEQGTLIANGTEVCIMTMESSNCETMPCLSNDETNISLEEITNITIEKSGKDVKIK